MELEWVEGDAESLPFGDGEFDVVTSSVGAIFAPDHQAVADELVRVCRPGGTIGMINFTPEGLAADFFALFGRHAPPPPPGALPPVLWGSEAHVRELFGDRLASLELTRRRYVERSPGDPAAYCDFFKQTFGPVVGLYASLADEPDRLAALDRDFLDFATRSNQAPPDAPAEYAVRVPARRRPHARAEMTAEGFVGFRGLRTWYRIAGDRHAATDGQLPLLLLHGGPGFPSDPFESLEALARSGRPVIRYDQIGCGRSDRPHDPSWWTVETFVDELATVRRELGLDHVHLLGWSWGGMLALEYLLTKPEGIASVVLTSTPPSIPLYVEEARRLRDGLPEHVKRTMRRFEHSYRPKPPRPTTKVSNGMSTRTAQRSARVIRPLMRLMATPAAARLASWASAVPALRRAGVRGGRHAVDDALRDPPSPARAPALVLPLLRGHEPAGVRDDGRAERVLRHGNAQGLGRHRPARGNRRSRC